MVANNIASGILLIFKVNSYITHSNVMDSLCLSDSSHSDIVPLNDTWTALWQLKTLDVFFITLNCYFISNPMQNFTSSQFYTFTSFPLFIVAKMLPILDHHHSLIQGSLFTSSSLKPTLFQVLVQMLMHNLGELSWPFLLKG